MSRLPIVHCHFMLHFYERINDDDDDELCNHKMCITYDNLHLVLFALLGHICHMPDNPLLKSMLLGSMEGV